MKETNGNYFAPSLQNRHPNVFPLGKDKRWGPEAHGITKTFNQTEFALCASSTISSQKINIKTIN